tara:strand:- start:2627 stop:2863 length:237 start_codon:yes stop_codon:yes gene_type:complete
MLRLYIIGLSILFIAIIINILINKIGLMNWYDFISDFFNRGIIVVKQAGFLNCIWLFFLYPIVLSLGYIIGDKIYSFI